METRETFVHDNRVQCPTPVHYHHRRHLDGRTSESDTYLSGKEGQYKTVTCSRGGKFIPGELKLRSFSAKTETVLYGTGSIEAVTGGNRNARPPRDDGWSTSWTGPLGLWSIGPLSSNMSPITIPSNLGSLALLKAKAKFHASGEDLGQFFAELPESVDTVRKTIEGIMAAIRKARKAGFSWKRCNQARLLLRSGRTLKSLPKRFSNAWLQWRYGIRPLFWDALMLIRIINERYKRSPDTGLLRKSATESFEDMRMQNFKRSTGDTRYDYRVQVSAKVRAKATIYYRKIAQVRLSSDILHYYGLHPEQLPALLWELTPLSFVVDWFANVGEWIKAITPRADVRIEGYCVSTRTSLSKSRVGTGNTWPGSSTQRSYKNTASYPEDKYSLESLDRAVGGSLADLSISLKPQILLSIQQKMDLISLAIQKMLGNRRRV